MPDKDAELDTGETVIVATGDTVISLVTVDVMGTWLVESLSLVVGVQENWPSLEEPDGPGDAEGRPGAPSV